MSSRKDLWALILLVPAPSVEVLVLLCPLGIFIGGAVWSWFYAKYRSIWPGYLSHAVVDLAVFGISYKIIFGI